MVANRSSLKSMEDALLQAFGRVPLRFSLEVIPKSVSDLPRGVTSVSVVWEKGSKVTYTEASDVDRTDSSAAFAQVMRQTTTVYKQGNTLLPKLYTFKVQSLTPPTASSSSNVSSLLSQLLDTSTSRRRTIARSKLDLAQFCSAQSSSSAATEVQVPLQPQGVLVLSIKSVWLQHYDRAKSAQLAQQGPERSFAQHWGSASAGSTSTDVSSMTYGSCLTETDRDELGTGSAELDRLLQEAEAATAAKTSAPRSALKGNCASSLILPKPRILTLASLSTGGNQRAPQNPPRPHSTGSLLALLQTSPQSPWASGPRKSGLAISTVADSTQAPDASSSTSSCRSSGSGSRRHRRASSVPDTPTILEVEREGPDAGSFVGLQHPEVKLDSTTGQLQQKQEDDLQTLPQLQDVHAALPLSLLQPAQPVLPFGLNPAADSSDYDEGDDATAGEAVWMDACASGTGIDACASGTACALQKSSGPEGLRSLSGRMPAWLWPSSRLAVRGLTTDEIMRRISSNRDVVVLQGMCRGLLCERNEWRFRATQAERTNESLQQDLQQLHESEASAREQLQQQQPEGALLQKLVEAKLELAQADLLLQDLKGQLERERKRHMSALTRMTSLQANFDSYINEQQAGRCGECKVCVGTLSEGRVHGAISTGLFGHNSV